MGKLEEQMAKKAGYTQFISTRRLFNCAENAKGVRVTYKIEIEPKGGNGKSSYYSTVDFGRSTSVKQIVEKGAAIVAAEATARGYTVVQRSSLFPGDRGLGVLAITDIQCIYD